MKKDIKLIAVLFDLKENVLFEKYDEGYKLPTGTIKINERLDKAFKRFILEDTGMTIEMLDVVMTFNFDVVNQISIAYSCIPLSRYKPTKALPGNYKWFSHEETKKLILPMPYREIITRAYLKS